MSWYFAFIIVLFYAPTLLLSKILLHNLSYIHTCLDKEKVQTNLKTEKEENQVLTLNRSQRSFNI